MSEPIITVENLGKCYQLGGGTGGGRVVGEYRTLRDSLSEGARQLFGRRDESKGAAGAGERFWALRDVSFSVQPGEVVGIIGRNGAGKSTLLKVLSRITEPTEGRVRLRGRVASLLEVGTGFHPELTGRENIYLNGSILGMARAEIRAKFEEIVAFAEVERFLDTPVKRYSSGMYVRLAFAVAAHLEPEILIVDEVLAVGDAEFQKKCLGKMDQVAKSEGRTVLFVSHNLNAVNALCHEALFLQGGRLIYHGTVDYAVRQYANSAPTDEQHDLSKHSNRVPGSQTFFRRLRLLNSEGQPAVSFDPLGEVILLIDVHSAQLLREPRLGIAFANWKGDRVFAVATYMGQSQLPLLQGDAIVEVHFILPALFPGRYQMEIGAYDSSGLFIDEIYGAGAIEITNINYLCMTNVPVAEMGQVMVRSEWKLAQGSYPAEAKVELILTSDLVL